MEVVSLDHLIDMQQTVLGLIDDIKDNILNIPECSNELLIVKLVIKGIDKEKLMQKIIGKVLPHSVQIERRDISYFTENLFIFDGLASKRTEFYANKFRNGEISTIDMNVIWNFMDTIVAIAEDYKKVK